MGGQEGEEAALASHPLVQRLRCGELGSVVVLVGAGISVSAGIPDFRSPKTGLYDNLDRYCLPSPEDAFTLDYFRRDPWPFTLLAKELWPSRSRPTPTHLFIRLLEQKGLLHRHYTQNIDGLDAMAGISKKHLVQAHGSFEEAHCIDCHKPFDQGQLRQRIFRSEIARCSCGGLVKPDIVFFGEDLPQRFYACSKQDFQRCDLILCMGTSLAVEPFAGLLRRAPPRVPRLLVNREVPETFQQRRGDLMLLGDCDEQVWLLARALGWERELRELAAARDSRPKGSPRWQQGVLAALAVGVGTLAALQCPEGELLGPRGLGLGLWAALVCAIGGRVGASA